MGETQLSSEEMKTIDDTFALLNEIEEAAKNGLTSMVPFVPDIKKLASSVIDKKNLQFHKILHLVDRLSGRPVENWQDVESRIIKKMNERQTIDAII